MVSADYQYANDFLFSQPNKNLNCNKTAIILTCVVQRSLKNNQQDNLILKYYQNNAKICCHGEII